MRVSAAIALVLLLGLASGVGLLIRGTELPWLGGLLEKRISTLLGRPVRFAEKPFVRVGGSLELRLRDVSIANAPWAGPEPLATLAEADLVLETRSLFNDGPVLLQRLRVEGLRLGLVRDETGVSNLPRVLFDRDTQEALDKEEETSGEFAGPPLLLDELAISDVVIERTNRELETRQKLTITTLTQARSEAGDLLIDAVGTLQDEAWSLRGTHSGLRSLMTGEDLHGEATASLADLSLELAYRLADLRRTEDLTLKASLRGTLPPRIADLSPLLSAEQPVALDATISDIDPGVEINAMLDLGTTELRITGTADAPGSGDGLDLTIDADTANLAKLAQALDLGPTDDIALAVDGRIRRRGRRLEVDDLYAVAGDHRLTGKVLIPLLPGTTDARVTLHASGPDFGFYERLLKRPLPISAPYSADITLLSADDGRDDLKANLRIGTATLYAEGLLGDFPSYYNSELHVRARAEDLSVIGPSLDLRLPAIALLLDGNVTVSPAGRFQLNQFLVEGAGVRATLDGGMSTYPDLDDISFHLDASTPSLAETSRRLAGPDLGDVPATLSAEVRGSLAHLVIDEVTSSIGGSSLKTLGGALRIVDGEPSSDLWLAVQVGAVSELLGARTTSGPGPEAGEVGSVSIYESVDTGAQLSGQASPWAATNQQSAPTSYRRLRDRPFSFEVRTDVTREQLNLSMTKLEGAGISGSAEWRSATDFALDETLYLSTDLQLEDLDRLLPPIAGYTAPAGKLSLRAETTAVPKRITVQLAADGSELLGIEMTPRGKRAPARLLIRGAGDDVRRFGSVAALPEGPLPYLIEVEGSESETAWLLALEELRLGSSVVTGSRLSMDKASGSLTAAIKVKQADLAAWLPPREEEGAAPGSGAHASGVATDPEQRVRLIPATPLPLELLDGRDLDLTLTSGPLGLPDPQFSDQNLVERSDLSLARSQGKLQLTVRELRGSRGTAVLSMVGERADAGARLATDFSLEGLPIGILTTNLDPAKLPKHKIDGHFTGQGTTLRDLAATLNGEFLLIGTGGELKNLNLRRLTESFLEQLAGTLLPILKSDTPSLQVNCSVLALRARDGTIALDPGFVIRTDRVDLSARGSADLATERLTIRFDNQARRGLGISAASLVNPYVQITGTLAEPAIGLDVAGSAVAGGAALATGGLTVLAKPLFGRFLQRRNPCEIALERWEQKAEKSPGGP
jgi:uncharacterized protein involved in outer membrane biogenesis